MPVQKAADDILERATNEEILLNEAQFFSVLGVVIGIQHLGDGFSGRFLPDGFYVTALVKDVEIKLLRGAGIPEAEEVPRPPAIANDTDIKGYSDDGLTIDPHGMVLSFVSNLVLDPPIELYFLTEIGPHDLPWATFLLPNVGMLNLVTVFKLLPKEAKFIVDSVPHGRQIQSGQGIEEASSESPETPEMNGGRLPVMPCATVCSTGL